MLRTVRAKLMFSFLMVAMVPLLLLGLNTYMQMVDFLKNETMLTTSKEMVQLDHYMITMLQHVKEDNKMLATIPIISQGEGKLPIFFDKQSDTTLSYEASDNSVDRRIFTEFERYATSHPDVAYVYMGTKSGGYLQWPQEKVGKAGYDPRIRPWYQQSINNPDKVMISEPYQAYLGDNFIISTTNTIKDTSGQVIGVLGIDISLLQLSKLVEEFNTSNMSFLFIFTQDGLILVHPDKDMLFQPISKLAAKEGQSQSENEPTMRVDDYHRLLEEPDGFFETVMNGKEVFVNFQTSAATGWKIATVIEKSELLAKNQQVAFIISLAVLILILLTVWGTSFITFLLTRPLDTVVRHLQVIGNGDFTVRLSANVLKREDEIGKVAQAVDLMQKSRYQAEQQLKSSSEEMIMLYEQLASTEEELRAQFDELWDKQKKIERNEERYRLATEGANDAIWDWDIQTDRMVTSKRWVERLGWSDEEIKNCLYSWRNSIHPEDEERCFKVLENHLAGNTTEYLCEYRVRDKTDKYLWVLTRGKALFDKNGIAIRMAGSFTDITANKMRDLQIQYMAYYDSLTNLPNRASIMESLSSELESKEAVGAILFIDLDNFKLVNDSFGYEYGDRLLVQVAKKLQDIAGQNFVARLGGDEFILMIKGIVDFSMIENVAKAITQDIDQPFGNDKDYFIVTSSIGIALYPQDGNQPDKLMRSADIALHQAKREGKRCYQWFQAKFEQEMLEKLYMEQGLREAIGNKELVLYYQPIVDLSDGRTVGLEALLRWQSPDHGLILPDKFMPIAEESGLIVDIGQWVMRTACLFGKELLNGGQDGICIAVNVSVKELLQNDFVSKVARVLEETEFPSSCLELEIVETLLIDKFEVAIPKLHHLRAMGVQISLDDFGTGYSSLSYLKKLPIDTIKIDRTFLMGAMKKNTDAAIIETIIELAHRLQLKVVAEGVETEGQRFFLRKKMCDKIQGYLISKPIPKEKIWERLNDV
jgi:diguanylate cyclase (GGDEF)-like protein/PAS domain S-box-containing protein